jgi:hypothetical protein
MSIRYEFSQNVPPWTKLGSAEFFRLLEYPKTNEVEIRNKARELGVTWDINNFYIESNEPVNLDTFLSFVAEWYTKNQLSMVLNYDLVIDKDSTGKETLKPSPRPFALRHMHSNVSNIKPKGIKEIDLPDYLKNIFDDIKKQGTAGIPAEKFKSSKIYDKNRFLEFTVLQNSKKKGICFGCSKEDYLTKTKDTQYPITVGLENFANFYSYHSGTIGFCRTCAISNHLAFGRVLFDVSGHFVFLAVPEAVSIREILDFFAIIDKSYPLFTFIRNAKQSGDEDSVFISKDIEGWTNFLEKTYSNPGFYFLIIILFAALDNAVTEIIHNLKDIKAREDFENSNLMRLLFPEGTSENAVHEKISAVVFRSWSFILSDGDQNVRYWRYQNSKQILNLLKYLRDNCHNNRVISTVQRLIYKSGNNYINSRREDFSRSLLLGNPDIGILEKATWEIVGKGGKIDNNLANLAACLARNKFRGDELEKDEILKQCRMIGTTIARLSAEDKNRGLLYELRSVGNPQAFRSYIERFTFVCALRGTQTSISNDFVTKLFEADEWKAYKSIIAIIANQQYGYLAKEEVPAK